MKTLHELWFDQKKYNEHVKEMRAVNTGERMTQDQWTQAYLLGLISEVDEVLQEIKWKVHADTTKKDEATLTNLAIEFADITKYIMCLWQAWGFSAEDMLYWVEEKSNLMDFRLKTEGVDPLQKNVVVCDLDGTIADWRDGFFRWLAGTKGILFPEDKRASLLVDVDMRIPYTRYNAWKEEFERSGGYRELPPYKDGVALLSYLQSTWDAKLIFVTARPIRIARVLLDTLHWIRATGLEPYSIRMVETGRVQYAMELKQKGNRVLVLDDDPVLVARASNNHLPVLVRAEPYNTSVQTLVNVFRTPDFMSDRVLRGVRFIFGGGPK